MTTLLAQFDSAVAEIGNTPDSLNMYVFAIGLSDGRVHPRLSVRDARISLIWDDAIWFEIRPYNQPFTPGGYARATNADWKLAQIRRDNAMLSEDVDGSMYGNNTQG